MKNIGIKSLDRYLLKQFLPVYAASVLMFILLIILIDLFIHLVRFLNAGAEISLILKVSFYYIPKSFLYALPVALLFASAYTLGDLYARNELSVVMCSGVPFWRFCIPLFVIGLAASFFSFFFEDRAVIPSLRMKNELTRQILQTQNVEHTSDIVIKAEGGRLVYAVDFFDTMNKTLNGLTIVELDENKTFVSLIRSQRAEWTGEEWTFNNPLIYDFSGGFLRARRLESFSRYNEDPDTFMRNAISPEDLNARDAALHLRDLKEAGLPVVSALADYYHRFSFSAVSFVVMFLSVSFGGRFKKNILLMNLLTSLGTAVVFYVIEMITMMSARTGLLPPVLGAWIPVFVCSAGGFFLLRYAKT
jgi:lipopolysaccharide export system permease protein